MFNLNLFFHFFSICLVFSTFMVVVVRHPVFSLLFLVASFIFSTFLLFLLECEFLALLFIIGVTISLSACLIECSHFRATIIRVFKCKNLLDSYMQGYVNFLVNKYGIKKLLWFIEAVLKSSIIRNNFTSFGVNNNWLMSNKHSQSNLNICHKSTSSNLGFVGFIEVFWVLIEVKKQL